MNESVGECMKDSKWKLCSHVDDGRGQMCLQQIQQQQLLVIKPLTYSKATKATSGRVNGVVVQRHHFKEALMCLKKRERAQTLYAHCMLQVHVAHC
ncbi:unnamed protein product [Ceratitis capitata]|uniref:(Mediterranean fruit fly) hypothetical protein n=1 Tax=Ceratitis capitata TaxID=7213 RepID=A0A811VCL7_CERCA|nr:unnamed protein product [Ceratitis capitata]